MNNAIKGFKWGIKALEIYCQTLEIDSLNIKDSSEDITIALIGKSQEGKSSLALRLLGVNPDEIELISKILKGKRKTGESVTPVPLVYTFSGKQNFDKKLKALKEQVDDLRKKHENTSVKNLELPLSGKHVGKIIDLVGLSPRDNKEKELAKKYAKQWLVKSDVQAVVSRFDHISDIIDSKDREIKYIISRWQDLPELSLIIITFAYENQNNNFINIKRSCNTPKELFTKTKNYYMKLILNEMNKLSNRKTIERNIPEVLPVSCPPKVDLEKEADKLIFKATEISLKKIREIIITEQPLLVKLKKGFNYPRFQEKEIEEKKNNLERVEKDYNEYIEKNKRKCKKEATALASFKKRIDRNENIKDKLEDYLKDYKKRHHKIIKDLKKHIKSPRFREKGRGENRGEYLIDLAKKSRNELLDIVKKDLDPQKNNKDNFEEICSDFLDKIRKAKGAIIKNFKKKMGRGYSIKPRSFLGITVPFAGINLKKNIELIKEQQKKDYFIISKNKNMENEIKNYYITIFEKELEKKKEKIKKFKLIKKKRNSEFKKRRTMRAEELKKRKAQDKKIKNKMAESRNKLSKAREYKRFINEEFCTYWNKEVSIINNSCDQQEIMEKVTYLKKAYKLYEELVKFSTN